jgi:hypothetical protein
MSRLEQEPHLRVQLKNLILHHCPSHGYSIQLNQLLTTLPYLRVLCIHSKDHCFQIANPVQVPWNNSIEALVVASPILGGPLFVANVFDHLKVLILNAIQVLFTSLLWMLEKAPALEELGLQVRYFFILDVDEMHTKLPKLAHFTLQLNNMNSDELPELIQPCSLMKSISVFMVSSCMEDRFAWFKYICQKYTHVSEIQYHGSTLMEGVKMVSEMDPLFRSFIRHLGTTLKTLEIKALALLLDMTWMDQSNISALSIRSNETTQLTNSFMNSQLQHIQKLHLGNLNSVHVPCLSSLSRLKKLSLQSANDSLSADILSILYMIPESLESLELHHIKLISINRPLKLLELRSLAIYHGKLDRHVDFYLNRALPKLRSLILISCLYHDKGLALSSISLCHLEIGLEFMSTIVIQSSKKRRFYMAKHDDWCLLKGYRQTDGFRHPHNPSIAGEHPYLTLECESVKDVFVFIRESWNLSY